MDKSFQFYPLTPERWTDLEKLFGEHGASGGCWCMWWRQTRAEFSRLHGESNRLALKSIVESGAIPGILAYSNNEPVGWCAISPRESYSSLERSRTLARVDNKPVWSITCFYIDKHWRGKGLMRNLLTAAVNWAGENGARIIEAYPYEPKIKRDSSLYMGIVPVFGEEGFVEVMRRSTRHPIMRKIIK